MTTIHAYNTVESAPSAPIHHPIPADRDEYASTHCPLCGGPLWQRVHGLYCPRDRGWLVETLVEGRKVYSLWQGKP